MVPFILFEGNFKTILFQFYFKFCHIISSQCWKCNYLALIGDGGSNQFTVSEKFPPQYSEPCPPSPPPPPYSKPSCAYVYSSLKKPKLLATAVRFFTLKSNLHKLMLFLTSSAVKTNVDDDVDTTNALNSRHFYPVLGELTWVRKE